MEKKSKSLSEGTGGLDGTGRLVGWARGSENRLLQVGSVILFSPFPVSRLSNTDVPQPTSHFPNPPHTSPTHFTLPQPIYTSPTHFTLPQPISHFPNPLHTSPTHFTLHQPTSHFPNPPHTSPTHLALHQPTSHFTTHFLNSTSWERIYLKCIQSFGISFKSH
ncbi:hypothetical protein Pmani_034021 [Petrolisthes manimaculis]|uniref:Uncharacterized protein n=1 Tax=Petrolisthes manimaculis TaxID=1843537 RepID=A0AAE1NPG7_9EUCA|nr:hypothetical protein Pmani_034021 [Petrolisthes manimaculis]